MDDFTAARLVKVRQTIDGMRATQQMNFAGEAPSSSLPASASTSQTSMSVQAQLQERQYILSNARLQPATHPYEFSVYVATPFTLEKRHRALKGVISDVPPRDEVPHPDTVSPRVVISSLVSQPLIAEGPTAERAISFQASCGSESMALDAHVRFIGGEPAPALLLRGSTTQRGASDQAARSVAWKDFAGPAADRDSDSLFATVTVPLTLLPAGMPTAASKASGGSGNGDSAGTGVDHGSASLPAGLARQTERTDGATGASTGARLPSEASSSSFTQPSPPSARVRYEAVGRVLAEDLCTGAGSQDAFPAVKPSLSPATVVLLSSLHACRAGLSYGEHSRQTWNTRLAREPLAAGLGAPGRMNREYAVY